MPGGWIEAGRAPAFSVKAGQKAMPVNSSDGDHRKGAALSRRRAAASGRRLYAGALPCFATPSTPRYAVQECYLRALRHCDSYRGPAMKPWLFAILRNVCRAEFCAAGRAHRLPRSTMCPTTRSKRRSGTRRRRRRRRRCLHRWDSTTIGRLVAALAEPFQETLVLREIHDLSNTGNRRHRRRAGWHRDVASRPRPAPSAISLDGGRGATEMTCDEAEILLSKR